MTFFSFASHLSAAALLREEGSLFMHNCLSLSPNDPLLRSPIRFFFSFFLRPACESLLLLKLTMVVGELRIISKICEEFFETSRGHWINCPSENWCFRFVRQIDYMWPSRHIHVQSSRPWALTKLLNECYLCGGYCNCIMKIQFCSILVVWTKSYCYCRVQSRNLAIFSVKNFPFSLRDISKLKKKFHYTIDNEWR